MIEKRETQLGVTSLVACATAIGIAHASETLLGLVPCAFCLLERKPFIAGLWLSMAALLLGGWLARIVLWLVVAVIAAGAAISFVHVGVEWHLWPDPLPACSLPNLAGLSLEQRLAALPARPAKPCEDPDFLIPFLPISMAQMAFVYALVVSGGLATLLLGRAERFLAWLAGRARKWKLIA